MNKGAPASKSSKANVSGSVSYGPLLADLKSRVRAAQAKAAVDEQRRHTHDQPTIGLLLCKEKNRLTVEYALRDIKKPVGVAEWKTRMVESLPKQLRGSLPSIEDLEAGLAGDRSTKPTTQL
ncbi:MAG: PDDEXK nuclease domain-containing protein [Opitutaceae bacterium]|jgi:hypothetical protein